MTHDTHDTYYTDDALESMVYESTPPIDYRKLADQAESTIIELPLRRNNKYCMCHLKTGKIDYDCPVHDTYQDVERGSFPELKPVDYDDPKLGKDNVITLGMFDNAPLFNKSESLFEEKDCILNKLIKR